MLRHTTAQFIFIWTHTCIYIFYVFYSVNKELN